MDKYIIDGGNKLYGAIKAQSAKNSVLPLLAAAVLTDEEVVIHDIPTISDVENMLRILGEVGCVVKRRKNSVVIDSSNAAHQRAAFFRFYARFGAYSLLPRKNILSWGM